jgi:shikimate kinase
MGSGKSYIGQRLAERLYYNFADLDTYIIENEALTISQIFEKYDETYFRQKESYYLKTFPFIQNTIMSTGGGTPCFYDNMTWMNQQGITIYLKPSVNLLMQRLEKERIHRPLLRSLQTADLQVFIENKIAERSFYYNQANYTIPFDESNQNEVLAKILSQL